VLSQFTELKDRLCRLNKGSFLVSSLYKGLMQEVNVLDNLCLVEA